MSFTTLFAYFNQTRCQPKHNVVDNKAKIDRQLPSTLRVLSCSARKSMGLKVNVPSYAKLSAPWLMQWPMRWMSLRGTSSPKWNPELT